MQIASACRIIEQAHILEAWRSRQIVQAGPSSFLSTRALRIKASVLT